MRSGTVSNESENKLGSERQRIDSSEGIMDEINGLGMDPLTSVMGVTSKYD